MFLMVPFGGTLFRRNLRRSTRSAGRVHSDYIMHGRSRIATGRREGGEGRGGIVNLLLMEAQSRFGDELPIIWRGLSPNRYFLGIFRARVEIGGQHIYIYIYIYTQVFPSEWHERSV